MPEVLIKADDLRPDELSPRWRAFLELCVDQGIHANVGLLGGWPKNRSDDEGSVAAAAREMLSWLLAQPTLGVWNHGFTHQRDKATGVSEFKGASLDDQIRAIRLTQERIEELCGLRMNAFGAPFNWTDHNTVLALQHFPEIEYAFHTPYVPGKVSYHHELFVVCEPFVGKARPGADRQFSLQQALRRSKHFRDIGRSYVLQIHPNRWVDGSLDDFSSFLETLAGEGYTTGTVESLARQDHFAGAPTPTPDASRAVEPADPRRLRRERRVPEPVRRLVPLSLRRRLRGRGE